MLFEQTRQSRLTASGFQAHILQSQLLENILLHEMAADDQFLRQGGRLPRRCALHKKSISQNGEFGDGLLFFFMQQEADPFMQFDNFPGYKIGNHQKRVQFQSLDQNLERHSAESDAFLDAIPGGPRFQFMGRERNQPQFSGLKQGNATVIINFQITLLDNLNIQIFKMVMADPVSFRISAVSRKDGP